MLLPELQLIREKIEKKSVTFRTEEEKRLLDELIYIDSILTTELLNESGFEKRAFSLAASTKKCPCCGS